MHNNGTRSTSTSRMNPEGASARLQPEGSSANSTDVRLVSAETETIMVQKTILRQDCLPFVFFSGLFLVRRLCQILFVLLRCVLWRGVLLYFLLFLFFSSIRSSLLLDRGVNVPYLHTYIDTYIDTVHMTVTARIRRD